MKKTYYDVDVSITRQETHRVRVCAECQEEAEELADEMATQDRDKYYVSSKVIESEIIETKKVEDNEWL